MKNRLLFTLTLSIILTAISCKSDIKKSTAIKAEKSEVSAETKTNVSEVPATVVKNEKPKLEVAKSSTETASKKDSKIESKMESKNDIKVKDVSKPDKVKSDSKVLSDKMEKAVIKEEKNNAAPIIPTSNEVNPQNNKEVITPTTAEVVIDKPVTKPEKPIHTDKIEKPEKPLEYDVPVGYPNHMILDGFLKKYVSASGVVDYSGMNKDSETLNKYLTSLENSKIISSWSKKEKLVFWINVYNAYTIKLILDNYPVKKITDLHGGKPWDKKWIKLNGQNLSLNNIENDIIRPTFNEPRIHFAVNCAAQSCPPILNAAFTAGKLESQLESQTKKFINNPKHNTLGKNEITISKIFDWYGVDFGDVTAFIAKYSKTEINPNAKVKFNEYNWELNGK